MSFESDTRDKAKASTHPIHAIASGCGLGFGWLKSFVYDWSGDYGIRRVQKVYDWLEANPDPETPSDTPSKEKKRKAKKTAKKRKKVSKRKTKAKRGGRRSRSTSQ